MTTTTTTTTGQTGNGTTPPKNGSNGASADAKAKAALEAAKKEKKKTKEKARQKRRKEKNNNNNHVKFVGLIMDGVMKDVTITAGNSATMTSEFRKYKKAASVCAASKGYEHWPSVITNMEPVLDTEWKLERPNKNLYATKRITKIVNEDKTEILKQEWIVIDCEKQDELEDNHTNMQCQKTT